MTLPRGLPARRLHSWERSGRGRCSGAPLEVLRALDFQFDTTVDGKTLKLLNVDEFTRECPAIVVDRIGPLGGDERCHGHRVASLTHRTMDRLRTSRSILSSALALLI
ncbi:MAG: hypothetical protein WA797_05935 [Acidimicrobiales bacterium]